MDISVAVSTAGGLITPIVKSADTKVGYALYVHVHVALSLVPRPSLTSLFAAAERSVAAKKAVKEGLGTRLLYL